MARMTSLSFRWRRQTLKPSNQESLIATTMKQPTAVQQAERKAQAIKWAKERLADKNTIIVDVETTGLLHKDPDTEIVQITCIDTTGRVIFSTLVNPLRPIPIEAQKVHGIDDSMVKTMPAFDQCIGDLVSGIFHEKHIVAFNAGFDVHLIVTLFQKYGVPIPEFKVSCAMEEYSAFCGEWSKSKNDYKWQRLPKLASGKAHDSMVDAMSTLLLMRRMTGDFSDQPQPEDIELDF